MTNSPMPVWKNGAIANDGLNLVPMAEYVASNRDLGTAPVLAAGDDLDVLLEAVGGDLSTLETIALEFPSFADGRSYSKAQLLRDAHGYEGEIRAVGDVLPDQVDLMLRVGFDALEASHPVTRERMESGQIGLDARHTQVAPASQNERASDERFSWRRFG